LTGHTNTICGVAFSPDNLKIVSGSRDNSIKIWDAHTGQLLNTLNSHTNDVNSVAFSYLAIYPINARLREYIRENKSIIHY